MNPDGSLSGGRYLLQNSLDGLKMSFNSPSGVQHIENKSGAIFAQANWHFGDPFTLTTGVRFTREDRTNRARSAINDNGNAPELNPVAVNGVALGGFAANTLGVLAAAGLLFPEVADSRFLIDLRRRRGHRPGLY